MPFNTKMRYKKKSNRNVISVLPVPNRNISITLTQDDFESRFNYDFGKDKNTSGPIRNFMYV